MKNSVTVFVDRLGEEPYASVLCYPRVDANELMKRLEELRVLGVRAVEFSGEASVSNVPVVGKGYVGVVVIAYLDKERVALKIRRIDADRVGLNYEAEMLQKANSVNIGPKFVNASKNFLLMQFIDGDLLPRWLVKVKEKQVVRNVLAEILEQCYRLDSIGLDHGEISKAPKHLIVDKSKKPWIVDFETSSINRKPANVTAVCQYLFSSNGAVARVVADILGERSIDNLIDVLRIYKKFRTRENFERVLQTCLY